jgi:hypothetical protein
MNYLIRSLACIFSFSVIFAVAAMAQDFTQSFHRASPNPSSPNKMASGSFRNNGLADIVVAGGDGALVLLNNGDGTFSTGTSLNLGGSVDTEVSGVLVQDFDGDGNQDILLFGFVPVPAINPSSYTITALVFYGIGDGTFSAPFSLPVGGSSTPPTGPVVLSAQSPVSIGFGTTSCSNSNPLMLVNTKSFPSRNSSVDLGQYNLPLTGPCTGSVTGAINGNVIVQGPEWPGGVFVNPVSQTQAGASLCQDDSLLADGSYLVSYAPISSNFCVQQPPSTSTVATGGFLLSGDETLASMVPILLENNQPGFAGLISSPTSATDIQLYYGPSQFDFTTRGNVGANLTSPTQVLTDTFFPHSSLIQDIAVLDSTGLTTFVQGTISGTFSATGLTFSPPPQISASKQIVFTNTGTLPLVSLAISFCCANAGGGVFTQTNNCPSTLPAGASCNVTVTFWGTSGSFLNILVASNSLLNQTVPLTGTVTIPPGPSITSETPASGTVTATVGGYESFSVVATAGSYDGAGNVVLTYTWSKNGVVMPGMTTSSLAGWGPVQASDNGAVFSVSVSDGFGTPATAQWTLAVTSPTFTLGLSPATQTITAGQSAIYYLQVVAPSNAGLTCAASVPGGTCSLSASQSASGQVTVTVTTPTTAVSPMLWYIIAMLLSVLMAFASAPQYRRRLVPVMASLVLIVVLVGCGTPGSGSITKQPTSNSYTVTATGQLNGVGTQTATATLVVQQ